jgi:hypothetical protein
MRTSLKSYKRTCKVVLCILVIPVSENKYDNSYELNDVKCFHNIAYACVVNNKYRLQPDLHRKEAAALITKTKTSQGS